MQSLVDVAKAMNEPPNESTATLSLVDFAKKQASSAIAAAGSSKPLTLVEVARQETISTKMEQTRSLQSLAQRINEEDTKRVEQALTSAVQQVRAEQREHQVSVLKEAAAEVRREEAQAAQSLVAMIERANEASSVDNQPAAAPVSTAKDPTSNGGDDDGYSSFGDDDNDDDNVADKAKASRASTKPRKQQVLDEDNESEGDANGPERTTASDSPKSKAFLRAVYRADLRKIQDMLDSGDASATTADQVGSNPESTR